MDGLTALKVISEVGTDMARWPSANRAAVALRTAANALRRSDSALGAFLRRKKAHLGVPQVITAAARKLARIIYSLLRCDQKYMFSLPGGVVGIQGPLPLLHPPPL